MITGPPSLHLDDGSDEEELEGRHQSSSPPPPPSGSSARSRSRSRSPVFRFGGASSAPLEPRANDFRGSASSAPQGGGGLRASFTVEEPSSDAIHNEDENGDDADDLQPANPRTNRRHTNRSRKSRINPNSQGQLYEKYMQAKIRAEEARAENYATGAEANRAALQAAADQSQASRDTSRAMVAMAAFFENENRKSSSSSGIVYPSTFCSG